FAGGCAFSCVPDTTNPLAVEITYIGWPGAQTFYYDFGDGIGTSTLQNPTYTYATPGNYTITLTIDSGSCTYTLIAAVGSNLHCNFMYSPVSSAPVTIVFANTTAGNIISYMWDFGDGSAPSTIQNPSHTYTVPGNYSV